MGAATHEREIRPRPVARETQRDEVDGPCRMEDFFEGAERPTDGKAQGSHVSYPEESSCIEQAPCGFSDIFENITYIKSSFSFYKFGMSLSNTGFLIVFEKRSKSNIGGFLHQTSESCESQRIASRKCRERYLAY